MGWWVQFMVDPALSAKRRDTLELHYQLGFETLGRQFLHSHDRKRAHWAWSMNPRAHTENRICFWISPSLQVVPWRRGKAQRIMRCFAEEHQGDCCGGRRLAALAEWLERTHFTDLIAGCGLFSNIIFQWRVWSLLPKSPAQITVLSNPR